MSYILEALKKSQQERELGQVPTLDTGPFAGARRSPRGSPWAPAALGLAGLAVVIALYAVLRQPEVALPSPEATPVPVPQTNAVPGPPIPDAASAGSVAPPMPPPAGPVVPSPAVAQAAPYQGDPRTQAANSPWTAPQPAQPMGPGTPDLAVPGVGPAASQPIIAVPPEPGGMESEEWSDDWMEMDQEISPAQPSEPLTAGPVARRSPRPARQTPPAPKVTPIPQDLRDEVAAFKDELRRESAGGKPRSPPLEDPKKLRLPDDVQARLPAFVMTAQIYDPDPTRRFVIINSLRYAVGETTREGLKVEQVLSDGVVLSFEGQRFFRRR